MSLTIAEASSTTTAPHTKEVPCATPPSSSSYLLKIFDADERAPSGAENEPKTLLASFAAAQSTTIALSSAPANSMPSVSDVTISLMPTTPETAAVPPARTVTGTSSASENTTFSKRTRAPPATVSVAPSSRITGVDAASARLVAVMVQSR